MVDIFTLTRTGFVRPLPFCPIIDSKPQYESTSLVGPDTNCTSFLAFPAKKV